MRVKGVESTYPSVEWLEARIMLWVWNPDIWWQSPNKYRKTKMENYYRAKGIVLHDRALNKEWVYG